MAFTESGWPVHIYVVAARPALALVISEALAARGLPTVAAEVTQAIGARGGWLVVLCAEHWDGEAEALLRRLQEAGREVAVLCRDASDPSVADVIVLTGASEAYPDTPDGLEALTRKLRRRLDQELPSHWQLGPRVYEATQCRLSRRGQPVDLTPTENRLLWRLCRARLETPGEGLHARALGQAAGIDDDSSARHHMSRLRDKVGNDVLDHDTSGYYLVPEQCTPLLAPLRR